MTYKILYRPLSTGTEKSWFIAVTYIRSLFIEVFRYNIIRYNSFVEMWSSLHKTNPNIIAYSKLRAIISVIIQSINIHLLIGSDAYPLPLIVAWFSKSDVQSIQYCRGQKSTNNSSQSTCPVGKNYLGKSYHSLMIVIA